MEPECKHIAPKEVGFIARMRFHQSWYRRHVLGLSPGPNPSAGGELYGNMLRDTDGSAGWNFATAPIQEFAEKRVANDAEHIKLDRLRNNLLSSQPMCFNLFAPLALDLKLATRCVAALPGLRDIARVTAVKLEYAPSPKQDYLNDGSSFDAWVEYERGDGKLGFVGIETKLTEPFSNEHYAFDERYARCMTKEGWWWKPGAESAFSNRAYNQLWRNHLLAFSLRDRLASRYAECFCAVTFHPSDDGCPDCMASYAENLLPAGRQTLLSWPLGLVVNSWQHQVSTREERAWLQSLRLRYLDLEASEPAWRQWRAKEKV